MEEVSLDTLLTQRVKHAPPAMRQWTGLSNAV